MGEMEDRRCGQMWDRAANERIDLFGPSSCNKFQKRTCSAHHSGSWVANEDQRFSVDTSITLFVHR